MIILDQYGERLDRMSPSLEACEIAPGRWFYSPIIAMHQRSRAHPANDGRHDEVMPRVWALR